SATKATLPGSLGNSVPAASDVAAVDEQAYTQTHRTGQSLS
ncbi:hypothetical protein Ga0061067_1321, partial [Pannonibacter indicus]